MTTTLAQMKAAVENQTAKVLTLESAKELKGKRIATIYFGYRGQDGIDEFVIGDVKHQVYSTGENGPLCLYTADGRNTFIKAHEENDGAFTCSDIDRYVFFIEL